MFLKKTYFPLALLILLLSIVSCQPNYDSEAYLESILNPSSCQLPCWNGFVPDETSETELWKHLESQPANKVYDLRRVGSDKEVIIRWTDRELGGYHIATFDDGRLKHFQLFHLWLDIYMEEVISTIGTPDSYLATAGTDEVSLLNMDIFYEELGVHIRVFQEIDSELENKLNKCQASLSDSEALVTNIYLMPKQNVFSVATGIYHSDLAELYDWPTDGELFLTKCYQEIEE